MSTRVQVWSAVTQGDIDYAGFVANGYLASNPLPTIPVSGVTDLPDTRIRVKILPLLTYNDCDDCYTGADIAQILANEDKTAINVYLFYGSRIEATNPDPTNKNGLYIYFRQTQPSNVYGMGQILVHELGHMLGLKHAIFNQESGMVYKCGTTTTLHTVSVTDYYRKPYNTINTQEPCSYSNNFMNVDSGCNEYFSPGQIAVMHFWLSTKFARCLEQPGYDGYTVVRSSYKHTVVSNEVWNTPKYLWGDIHINPGKSLTINCVPIFMCKDAKITVDRGALLVVNGGTITNGAGRAWEGIEVLGNPAYPHGTNNPTLPGADLHQGVARINGAEISHARIGITDHSRSFQKSAGMVFVQNTRFINNKRDARFWGIPSQYQSYSYIGNSTLTVNGPIGDNLTPLSRIELQFVNGLKLLGCQLEYNYVGSGGDGIVSMDADYIVSSSTLKTSTIKNFDRGIYVLNFNPLALATISKTNFMFNKQVGAYFRNVYNLVFNENTVVNPPSSTTQGVYLDRCRNYKIRGNVFTEATTNGYVSTGIDVFRSYDGPHEIYKNEFYMLGIGINAFDNNNSPANSTNHMLSTTGLKMNCNLFNSYSPTYSNTYDIALTYTPSLSRPTVNKVQGLTIGQVGPFDLVRNIYGAEPCNGIDMMFYVASPSTMTIEHGSNTNGAYGITDPYGPCSSQQVNAQDMNIPLNYTEHCPGSKASSGGLFTTTEVQISNLNQYASALRAASDGDEMDVAFELQSTIASKVNCFISDSIENNLDSVIAIYDQNQGRDNEAEVLAVFACIKGGRYEDAQNRINELSETNGIWTEFLEKMISVQPNASGAIVLSDEDKAFFRTVAETENAPGQAAALSLIQLYADYNTYVPPHPVPEENLGARKRSEVSKIEPSSNLESLGKISKVYPNPTDGNIKIDYLSGGSEFADVDICDALGRILRTSEIKSGQNNLDINDLSNGIYIVTVKEKSGQVIQRTSIVKQQ